MTGMDEPRRKTRPAPALIAIVILCILFAAYVLAYFKASFVKSSAEGDRIRVFRALWQCQMYSPVAQVEASLMGVPVMMSYWDGGADQVYVFYDDYQP